MFPSWLRLLIAILLTLLVINLFLTLPKAVKNSENAPVAVLLPQKTYTCEVERVEGCTLFCYEIQTATLLRLRPEDCNSLKGLKKGQKVRFEVEILPYHNDGSIPVKLLPSSGIE